MSTQTAEQSLAIKAETVDIVAAKIRKFLEDGELRLPANYSPENALKSAWLVLQTTVDRDKNPVLQVCSKTSIANALLDTVVQGLNPAKKQCYYIAYGKELACQRSYFGTMAVAQMVRPDIEDIVAEVVYEGDEFTYRIERGQKFITKHEQSIANVDPQKIVAAYAVVFWSDGHQTTEIMPLPRIHQSWKQSRQNPFGQDGKVKPDTTHGKFPADMCMRTVINRVCKAPINSSDDSYLFQQAVHRTEDLSTDVEVADDIAEHANRETIDVQPEVVKDEVEPNADAGTPSAGTDDALFDDHPDEPVAAGAPKKVPF